jgi:hypothetical protein
VAIVAWEWQRERQRFYGEAVAPWHDCKEGDEREGVGRVGPLEPETYWVSWA